MSGDKNKDWNEFRELVLDSIRRHEQQLQKMNWAMIGLLFSIIGQIIFLVLRLPPK